MEKNITTIKYALITLASSALVCGITIASADVPFPQSTTGTLAQTTSTTTTTVEQLSVPIDPTMFAALAGLSGLILGCLITLAGAYIANKLSIKTGFATHTDLKTHKEFHTHSPEENRITPNA
jgi:hypothetical protein